MIKRDNIRIENPRVGGSISPLATMILQWNHGVTQKLNFPNKINRTLVTPVRSFFP